MCLKFLRSVGFEWDLTTCCRAARNGFRDILEWCLENGCTTRDRGMVAILHNAAKSGSVYTLEFAVKKFNNTVEMNDMSVRGGVEGGHIPILDWIRAEVLRKNPILAVIQRTWGTGMWRNAAYAGNIGTLEWGWEFARRAGTPDPAATSITSWGALSGNITVLEWLSDKGFAYGTDTWTMGVRGWDEEVIDYLRGIGCPGS